MVLTDRPGAGDLALAAERAWLSDDDREAQRQATSAGIGRSLLSGRVWLLCAVFFMNTIVTYGVFLWLPRMLQDASGASGFRLSAITAIPFVAALVGDGGRRPALRSDR